jgi:hypothetical protein
MDRWILDGDLGPHDAVEARLPAADTIILLDWGRDVHGRQSGIRFCRSTLILKNVEVRTLPRTWWAPQAAGLRNAGRQAELDGRGRCEREGR